MPCNAFHSAKNDHFCMEALHIAHLATRNDRLSERPFPSQYTSWRDLGVT